MTNRVTLDAPLEREFLNEFQFEMRKISTLFQKCDFIASFNLFLLLKILLKVALLVHPTQSTNSAICKNFFIRP